MLSKIVTRYTSSTGQDMFLKGLSSLLENYKVIYLKVSRQRKPLQSAQRGPSVAPLERHGRNPR